jgi:chromosome segregation ATPase
MTTVNLDKSIKSNIAKIIVSGNKQKELAFITLAQIIEHGNTTRHYDRLPELLNAVSSNASLIKDLKEFYIGKVPHNVVLKNGKFTISKRDDSLLANPVELELKAEFKAEKQALTQAQIKAKNALKKEMVEKFPVLQQDLFKANEVNSNLINEKTTLLNQVKELQAQVDQVKPVSSDATLQAQVVALQAQLKQANDYIQELETELKSYQVEVKQAKAA